MFTKPEEVRLRWEVSWRKIAASDGSGKEMRSRLASAGALLRGQTRLDVVKFVADGFSELAKHGRSGKGEPRTSARHLCDTAPHRETSPETCEDASVACPKT